MSCVYWLNLQYSYLIGTVGIQRCIPNVANVEGSMGPALPLRSFWVKSTCKFPDTWMQSWIISSPCPTFWHCTGLLPWFTQGPSKQNEWGCKENSFCNCMLVPANCVVEFLLWDELWIFLLLIKSWAIFKYSYLRVHKDAFLNDGKGGVWYRSIHCNWGDPCWVDLQFLF